MIRTSENIFLFHDVLIYEAIKPIKVVKALTNTISALLSDSMVTKANDHQPSFSRLPRLKERGAQEVRQIPATRLPASPHTPRLPPLSSSLASSCHPTILCSFPHH